MRGVFGLALIVVGLAMGWLTVIGRFPPASGGKGILGLLAGNDLPAQASTTGGS